MARHLTRRRFLEASAGAAVTAAIEPAAFAKTPDGPNVVLFVVDSLRADAVYDSWVRTPNMDALRRRGLSFTNVYPEAMPTVPARNSILGGRRHVPVPRLARPPRPDRLPRLVAAHACGRRAHERLPPGRLLHRLRDRQPVPRVLASPTRPCATASTASSAPAARSAATSRSRACRSRCWTTGSTPRSPRASASGSASTSPTAASGRAPDNSFAARVFKNAIGELDRAAAQRAPVRSGRRHLRAARAVDAAASATSTCTATRWRGPRAVDAALHAHERLAATPASADPSSAG